jgi:hypothetical protein
MKPVTFLQPGARGHGPLRLVQDLDDRRLQPLHCRQVLITAVSGVYLYRLQAAVTVLSRESTLLK